MSGLRRHVVGWVLNLVLIQLMFVMPVAADELLVCAIGSDNLVRYDANTGQYLGQFAPPRVEGLRRPHGMDIGPDGHVYVAVFGDGSVFRFDGKTGRFIDKFIPTRYAGLRGPTDAQFGPDGNLYVASFPDDKIYRFDGLTGEFLNIFVEPKPHLLHQPELMTFGPDDNLYVTSRGTDSIARYDGRTGRFIDSFVPTQLGRLTEPHGLVFGPNGDLFVSSFNRGSVHRYDGVTGAFKSIFVVPGSGGLERAHGMAFGPDGDLYVCSLGTDEVLRFDGGTGEFVSVVVSADTYLMNGPSAIFWDLDRGPRLRPLEPGIPGEVNQLVATGVTPGHTVSFFVADEVNIRAEVPNCPGVSLDLLAPQLWGRRVADENGVATIAGMVPSDMALQDVVFQAVDRDSCLVTNPSMHTFPRPRLKSSP